MILCPKCRALMRLNRETNQMECKRPDCGHIEPKGKELGYWGFKSSSGRSLKWNCTDSLTFQDTCNRQDTSKNDENWMGAIWGFLKQI